MTTEQITPISSSTYRLFAAISALHTISLELSARSHTPGVLNQIIQCAVDLLDADGGGSIYLYDPARGGLVLTAAIGEAEEHIGLLLRPGEGLAGQVFSSGEAQAVPDYFEWIGQAQTQEPRKHCALLSVPLRWHDEVIGALNLSIRSEGRSFTSDDLQFAELFASQASIAIGNVRLIDSAQRRIEQLDTLRAIALELLSATDVKDILRLIARAAQEHAQAQDVHVYLYDQATDKLTFGTSQWADGTIDREYSKPRPEGVTNTVARTGRRVLVVDPRNDPLFAGTAGQWDAITGFVSVPFRRGSEVLGVMNIAFDRQTVLDKGLLNFLDLLAAQAAVAIYNAKLFSATERRAAEFDRLRTVAVEMLSTNDVSSILQGILREVVEHCRADDARIYLYDASTNTLKLTSSFVPGKSLNIPAPRPDGLTATVAHTGERIVVSNPTTHPLYTNFQPHDPDWRFDTIVGVPLKRGGEVMGVLNAIFNQPITDEILRFLDLLAAQAAVALQNAELFEAEHAAHERADAALKAALTLSSTLSLGDLLESILQECRRVLPLCSGAIMIYENNIPSIVALTGHEGREDEIIRLVHEDMASVPLFARMRSSTEPLIVHDTLADSEWVSFEPTSRIRSWMGIPLIARGAVTGVLSLDSDTPHAFNEGHIEMAQALAAHAAIAIENAQLLNHTQEALAQLEAVFKASQGLITAADMVGMLRAVTEPSLQAGNCNAALLYALKNDVGELEWVEVVAGTCEPEGPTVLEPGSRFRLADFALGRIVLNNPYEIFARSELMEALPADDPARPIFERTRVRSHAAIPVFLGERLLGWLLLLWSEPHDFSPGEEQYYRVLAPQIAAIMENRRLFEQTRYAEERFRDIAFSTSDWVWETNEFSRLTYCSEQVIDSIGYTPDELIGHTPYEFLIPEEAERLKAVIAYHFDRKERFEGLEFWGPHKDGHRVELVVSATPIIDPRHGEVIGYRGVTKDITEQRRAEQRDKLAYEIGQRMTSVLSLEELASAVVEQLRSVFDYYHATLFLHDAQTRTLRLRKAAGAIATAVETRLISVPVDARPSLIALCARLGQPVISNDVLIDPDYLPSILLPDTRSEAALPLMHGERLIGVLDVQANEPGRFTTSEVRALQNLSAHVSIAIENANLYEAERAARARADALRDASRMLSSTLSLQEVLQSILNQCLMALSYTASGVVIYHDGVPELAARAGNCPLDRYEPEEVSAMLQASVLLEQICLTRQPIILEDVRVEAWKPFPEHEMGGCWLGMPLIARDQLIAILMLFNEQVGAYTPAHLEFLQGLAGHAALAIENAQLYQALEQQASNLEDLVRERTREIMRQQEQLKAIVESAGEAIIFTDPDGIIAYANPAWERLTGFSSEIVQGQRAVLLFNGSEETYIQVKDAVTNGRGWSGDIHTRRPDGSEYDISITVAPVLDAAGTLANVVAVFRDITAQKEVDRMRRDFLRNISHELRTPITGMKLFQQLAQSGPEHRRHEYLDTIAGELNRLERLIEDLLDISQIDQGLPSMRPEPLDLNQIVREAQRAHQLRAEERGLRLEIALYDALPPIIGDRGRIMQVLVNLLTNAIHYTNPGDRIGVRTWLGNEDAGPVAMLSVWDTGIGIAPQDLPFVFNRFFRADTTRVVEVPGTGLGLSIVKEFVEMHNGRVTVESTLGQGTTFTVHLPIRQMGDDEQ